MKASTVKFLGNQTQKIFSFDLNTLSFYSIVIEFYSNYDSLKIKSFESQMTSIIKNLKNYKLRKWKIVDIHTNNFENETNSTKFCIADWDEKGNRNLFGCAFIKFFEVKYKLMK